jgi:hypothetical protein
MAAITPVSTLTEKSADISKWFDELVSSIRVEEMQIVTGIAPKEKQDFWKPFLENNMLEIARKNRESSGMLIIPDLLANYFAGIKTRNIDLKSLSFQLSDSKILVWSVVKDDDEATMDQLFLLEAEINAKYGNFGFHVSTTILEESDNCTVPPQFNSVI